MTRSLPLALLLLLAACAEAPSDEKLEQAVAQAFHQNTALLADHLKIRSENGVIYIYGLVSTYVEYADVERVAKATAGVKQVVNMTAVDNTRF